MKDFIFYVSKYFSIFQNSKALESIPACYYLDPYVDLQFILTDNFDYKPLVYHFTQARELWLERIKHQ